MSSEETTTTDGVANSDRLFRCGWWCMDVVNSFVYHSCSWFQANGGVLSGVAFDVAEEA